MKKPLFQIDRPAGVRFDLAPQVLAKWDVGVQAAAGDATISILEPIGADFFGDGVTAKRVTGALRAIGDKPVTVQLNSPGGDFFEGLAIYNALAQHTRDVTVEIIGLAASAASIIAMAGDRIEIAKAGFYMIHNTQWVAIGDRHVMAETAALMAKFDQLGTQVYADRTGIGVAEVGAMMDAETWLTGPEAVDKGFAEALLANEPAKAKNVKQAALFRVEQLAASGGLSRADARKLMADLRTELGTPSAALPATPSAGEHPEALGGLLADLQAFQV